MKQMWDQKDLISLIKEYSEGGGGSTYTAGTGISILDYVISIDTTAVPLKTDLATVATSGSYNDLSNKPTIPAAQVNSDWNAVSGVAQILNKPSLAAVATSGSYNDLTNQPTIPAPLPTPPASGNSLLTYVDDGSSLTLQFENNDYISVGYATNSGSASNADQAYTVTVLTTAPTEDNEMGGYIIVKLSSAPATYYNGYIYLIEETV